MDLIWNSLKTAKYPTCNYEWLNNYAQHIWPFNISLLFWGKALQIPAKKKKEDEEEEEEEKKKKKKKKKGQTRI